MATQTTALYDIMLKHRKQDYTQFIREHRYSGWMGKGVNAIIQVNDQLMNDGETVRLHFTDTLGHRNIGVGTLEGNEATFGTDYFDCKPIWYREAIKLKKSEAKKAVTNQARIQRDSVRNWMTDEEYEAILFAYGVVANDASAYSDTGASDGSTGAHTQQVHFTEASEAQRDAYLTANVARVQVGANDANIVSGDMSASLLNLTSADDGISLAFLRSLKRKARADAWAAGGTRPIRPLRSEKSKGREFFKVVMGSQEFEDLAELEDMKRYNTDARIRGVEDNPIFQDGDLLYKGMIIHEEPRLNSLGALGASGAEIAPVYLFGAQALGKAQGQRMRYTKSDNRDYEFFDGVGVEAQCSYEKIILQGGDRAGQVHGMIDGYVAR